MTTFDIDKAIRQVKKGKRKPFELIIEYYKNRLYGYVLKQVKNTQDAEDILQEVFFKAYRKIDQYHSDQSFTGWMIAISRNTVIDFMRKKTNVLPLFEDQTLSDPHSPESLLLGKEFSIELDTQIHKLPEKYQTVILLKYFEELSYEEIAKRLDISPNKVKWQLHQARSQLMKISEKEVELWRAK